MDREKIEKRSHNLHELFLIYSNFDPKLGLNRTEEDTTKYESILLSQADFWMERAGIIPQKLTLTETGINFLKFKKWRLNYEEFLEYLQAVCTYKQLDFDGIKSMLIEIDPPGKENT